MKPRPGLYVLFIAYYPLAIALYAQSIPQERQVTHREQSLTPYDPFTAEELWKRLDIPPSPFLSPEKALQAFEVAPGFRVECVAAEPLVVDPVMFEFDPDGRIWAVEFRGWMIDIEGTGEGDPIGQVVVLEDTDGDSFMDKSTVFLDKLVMARTISFVQGGVLVAEPPHLWFCRDTDGDLKCDEKTLVGKYGRPGNPEHTENGLMPSLDNWMYSANASMRHRFRDGKLIEDSTSYRGQWGITQDDYGRLFFNYENRPLHADLFPSAYAVRNKNVDLRRSVMGMNYDVGGGAREVFPIRVTPGITLGGNELRDDGTLRTFTIACGPSIYRGDQFPEQYRGASIIPEAAGNLVRLNHLSSDGVHIRATNAFGKQEWLATTDERFRPVCSRTGPDGAVYVCDLYRGIIEHVIYMMPYLRHQILSRNLDKPIGGGRIYRLVHEDKPLGPRPSLSDETSEKLVEHLSHPNGWWRDTAQRLLVERRAAETTNKLRQLACRGEDRLGRIHALWTLEGIDRLDWLSVQSNLDHEDAMVRSTAIRLAERFLHEYQTEFTVHLESLFADERPMVRLQLLLTLGEVKSKLSEKLMLDVLNAHPDRVFLAAAVSGLEGRELEFLERLLTQSDWTAEKEGQSDALRFLAQAVIHEGDSRRISHLLEMAQPPTHSEYWPTTAMLTGILESGNSRARWPSPLLLGQRPELLDRLARSSVERWREQAIELTRIITWPGDTTERETRPILRKLTREEERCRVMGEAVYNATCYSCHKSDGRGQPDQVPPLADSDWVNGNPDRLVRIVLQGVHGPIEVNGQKWDLSMPALGHSPLLNDERLAGLLTYIRRAWDNYGDPVAPELVASIRQTTADRSIPWSAEELLNPLRTEPGSQAAPTDPLQRYRSALSGGDAERGRRLFHTNLKVRCSACHLVGRLGGGFVGPDLTEVGKRLTREQLLESLIVPSATIAKGYETILVITDNGLSHTGIITSENEREIVLALPDGGSATLLLDEIEERIRARVSTMPQMANSFSVEEIADLVAYLTSLQSTASDQ